MPQYTQIKNEPKPPFREKKQKAPGLESKMRIKPQWEAPLYKAAGKLEGKVALVTGGDSGIGRAVAVLYAREGADVAITFLPEERRDAEDVKVFIESMGRECLLLSGDLTREKFCHKVVEETVKKLGGLDILVSNAAHQMRKDSLEKISFEEWDRTFKTNIYAYFHLAKTAVKHMKPGSAIIATSSETAMKAPEELADYSATKGAINTFTKSLAQMLAKKGIRVNAVAPGPVWTPLNPSDGGASVKKIRSFGQDQPTGRPAQPEEIAPAYVFLAGDADSSYISGAILPETGGEPVL
ncbi:MAG: SDR family oxidoreductase [Bdellovibrionaceae bacterium]|nr:SDR family oxidoreductase [Pseudobdellovibrionaceae bacterium]